MLRVKRIVLILLFKFAIHAVQKLFDSFDAVLIDLLSHFNLIVLFCGIVAAYCVLRNMWRNITKKFI